jgi:large subunit ribosomal protein L25
VEDLTLKVARRDILGKKVKALRRQGITPVHLFGHGIVSQALQCDTVQLKNVIAQAGMTKPVKINVDRTKQSRSAFIKEVQRSAVSKELLHVDFYHVRAGESIRVDVPIVFTGEAPALKSKGRMLTHGIGILQVECLPENIPPQIEIDLSQLEEIEQPVLVKDILLDPSVTVHTDPEQLVVKVSEVAAAVEEEVVEAEEEAEAELPEEEGAEQTGEAETEES